MKIFHPKRTNPGDKKEMTSEEPIADVGFNIIKFNNRPKPENKKDILLIGCFSEFGCEVVGTMYCIPHILHQNPGKYKIAVGWYGRAYLYRHLVDEFWEIKEDFMWLREYARAFHNESRNLKLIEKKLEREGIFVPSEILGKIAVGVRCNDCHAFWGSVTNVKECVKCKSTNMQQSIFGDVKNYKSTAIKIPHPSLEKQNEVKKWLGPNPVGVFARNRKCYGRNLQPDFYVKLIDFLEKKGYSPIWLGEKQSTLECPVKHILDFSRMEESRDLELTLAIISQLKFTVQFWTASTRLSAMMGTPYILFESPDQIWGNGQEGYRLNLCQFDGLQKIVACHYLSLYNDHEAGMQLLDRCINELEVGNEEIVMGLLETDLATKAMIRENSERIGG